MHRIEIRSVRMAFFLSAIFLFIASGISLAQEGYTGDMPPVALGTACGPGIVYHWKVERNTPWHGSALLAVPDGYIPSEWNGTDAFVTAFRQQIGSNNDAATMSVAFVALWPSLSSSPARLYGLFERSITVETGTIECAGGFWTQSSAGSQTQPDSSEWVRIMDDSVDQITTTAQSVEDAVNRLVDKVNSQPGADTRPHHSYTVVTQ